MVAKFDRCIAHRKKETGEFIQGYFSGKDRKILLVAAAGFDPRSALVPHAIAETNVFRAAVFIREDRPKPESDLLGEAEANVEKLKKDYPNCQIEFVPILESDNAVVGGRRVTEILSKIDLADFTDIVVDISALSIGISYPVVKYFYRAATQRQRNLHLFVVPDAQFDSTVEPSYASSPSFVHGFKGTIGTTQSDAASRLWIPQLAPGKKGAFQRIHDYVKPHETCPILPFPSRDPRTGDRLIVEYIEELESGWTVDPRNFMYAAEEEPLDIYRTLLRVDDFRTRVFRDHGGSLIVLSPIGSKVLALGSLLAALERNFPVAYLEAMRYSVKGANTRPVGSIDDALHLWAHRP